MAIVRYLTQGLDEEKNHLREIKKIIGSNEFKKIIISTAYLREKAVVLLEDKLHENSNKTIVLIGIRNGVTSVQALNKLLDTKVKIYAVDTGSNNTIFHVKNYVGFNDIKATVINGSANFTPSGFLKNIEGSSIIQLNLNVAEDKEYLETIINDTNRLINEYPENVLKITSKKEINQLFEDGRLVDENKSAFIKNIGKSRKNENLVPKMQLKVERILIKSKKEVKKEKNSVELVGEVVDNKSVVILDEPMEIIQVWRSKGLTERDLNVPSNKNANSTGSMLLKKGQYKIDQQTYFRKIVFKDLQWKLRSDKADYFEFATTQFYFVIDGINYGKRELELKYDTRTNTKTYLQKQPMMHLIWGSAKSLISNRNLLGKEMTLYKVKGTNNEFLINIE